MLKNSINTSARLIGAKGAKLAVCGKQILIYDDILADLNKLSSLLTL
jgi:hypothetical protein